MFKTILVFFGRADGVSLFTGGFQRAFSANFPGVSSRAEKLSLQRDCFEGVRDRQWLDIRTVIDLDRLGIEVIRIQRKVIRSQEATILVARAPDRRVIKFFKLGRCIDAGVGNFGG